MAPSLTAVTATTTGSTTAITVTVPSGVVADSTVLVVVFCNSNNSVTGLGSSGLTHAPGSPLFSPTNQYSINVLTKVATGSESGSYSLTMATNDFWAAGAARVDGADTSTTWDTNSGTGSAVNTSASASSLTTSMTTQSDSELLINVGGQFNGGTWTQPTGFTKDFTDTAAPGVVYFADLLQAVGGATGTLTTTCSGGASQMVDWLGAIRPAVSAPTGGAASPPLPPHLLFWLAAGNQQVWLGAGVGTQITADTGLAVAGLAAVSTTEKVAAVTGTASAGLAATGAARKVAPETGTSTAGQSATGTTRKVAPGVGTAPAGLAATSTIRKVAVTVDRSALGLAATDTAVHIAKPTGLSAAGLAGLAAAVRIAKSTGLSVAGLEAFQSGNVPRQGTGQALLGLSATVTARRVAKPTGTAPLGLCSTSTTRRVAVGTGRATAGLVARFAGIDLRSVTARAFLALWAHHHQCVTYRSFTGSTPRGSSGTTARPFAGTTEEPC